MEVLSPSVKQMVDAATSPDKTPFQYIIVGSGAGGGPLAARLARAGRKVLLLEAGGIAAAPGTTPSSPSGNNPGAENNVPRPPEVQQVPGYHAPATEDPEISWSFSVRHFADDARQQNDTKYCKTRDPSQTGGAGKGGIFYPRCSALGGCTAHHAMIIVAPNDRDWDEIAERTGDDSWRAESMQGYFTRIEKCLYRTIYQDFFHRLLGLIYTVALRLVAWINPRAVWDEGGHGDRGWQPTSFINPDLVAQIKKGDRTFRNVLVEVIGSLLGEKKAFSALKRALWQLRLVQFLDPNDRNNRRANPEGLAFIPIGTDGVRRTGVRELLLETQQNHPDRLVIVTETHVTKVLFSKGPDGVAIARGVEVAEGSHLYQASPLVSESSPGSAAPRCYFATQEVIICGGAFNTPQLLMLSGIGDQEHLKSFGIEQIQGVDGKPLGPGIHLPGVGSHLQDRYEIGVISQLNNAFDTLKDVSFVPGDSNDRAREEWFKSGIGLYTTNGGTVAILNRSGVDPEKRESDLFIFGAPASFRGYYWGWSKDLLHATPGAAENQRDLWSWVILKAYTRNAGGTVRLRSSSSFDTPEICFASFEEGPAGWEKDLAALASAVKLVRRINDHPKTPFEKEIQPGRGRPDDSDALLQWIKNEAWGHHACGTCRMGSDAWQADATKLLDRNAVLDSKFRVHGVRNLRVVDASVFPTIPGYFIVTPVFMISEKAADTILAETEDYPEPLRVLENSAVKSRRGTAGVPFAEGTTVGLALSGGGIRSATFCLGVLQALARKNRLRQIDFLSTVSGGGYIGGFLGRLFTRITADVADKAGRVQEIVADLNSPQIRWLRSTANYIAGGGPLNLRRNLAIFWRNLFAVHLVIAALLIAGFGVLKWVGDNGLELAGDSTPNLLGFPLSPWWWLAPVILGLAVLPGSLGFWLAPRPGIKGPHPIYSFLAWIVLLAGAMAVLALPGGLCWGAGLIIVLVVSYLWQEVARWNLPACTRPDEQSFIIRSKLTIGLGEAIFIFAGILFWIVLDTVAHFAAAHGLSQVVTMILLALGPLLPLLKMVTDRLSKAYNAKQKNGGGTIPSDLTAAIIAFPLAAFLLLVTDILAQEVFDLGNAAGILLVITLALFSLVIGRAFNFLNQSSLQSPYAVRLTRTFLGASNSERLFGTGTGSTSVLISHPGDDLAFDEYHPETQGGPIHLINVCVNETSNNGAERDARDRKGLSMCLGPMGVSIGRRFHSIWTRIQEAPIDSERRALIRLENEVAFGPNDKIALRSIPASVDPSSFHVLGRRDGKPAAVEPLRLGQWIGISGAAIGTGEGYSTSLPMSLLFGLVNIRLGYWWNSGINAGDRQGCYPKSLWQQIKSLPALLFRTQSMILSEWRCYFRGPSERFWYLSDGGDFENTGIYELVRRRLPFIIVLDASADPSYHYNDLARCTRLIRLDFGAELQWLDPTQARAAGALGWSAFDLPIPAWITDWLDPMAIGCREKIARTGTCHGAIGQIKYTDAPSQVSWVLLIKASLTGDESLDVIQYSTQDPLFPNSPTANQFFDDSEWESYRELGDHIGTKLFN